MEEKQRYYYGLYEKKMKGTGHHAPSQGPSGADPEGQGLPDQSLPSYTMAVKMDNERDSGPPDGAGAQADGGQAREWTLQVPQPTGQRPTAPEPTINGTPQTGFKLEPTSPADTPSTVVAEPGSSPKLEEANDRISDASLSCIAPCGQAGVGRFATSTPSVRSRPAGHRHPPEDEARHVSKLIY